MNKRPRRSAKAPPHSRAAAQDVAKARGEIQEAVFADARQLQERVETTAGPSSSRPRRALSSASSINLALLAGISIDVPLPPAVSEAAIDERLRELLRARAPVRELGEGEPLALCDDVLVDVIGYCNGVPMSAHVDTWMRLSPNALLPGLFEQIADGRLGEPRVLRILLPESYPQEERRGQPAAFVVRTKSARRASVPRIDVEDALLGLGRGETPAEVRKSVKDELLAEDAHALVEKAKALFLREAASRVPLVVDEGEIDDHLIRLWRLEEGDALALQGTSSEEQVAAREGFLANEERRAEARETLFGERLLESVVAELGLDFSLDDVVTMLVKAASASSLPVSDLHTRLRADESVMAEMRARLKQSEALHRLLEGATVRFGPS